MLKTTTRLANHECLTFFALGKKDIFLKSLCKSQKKPITRLWLSLSKKIGHFCGPIQTDGSDLTGWIDDYCSSIFQIIDVINMCCTKLKSTREQGHEAKYGDRHLAGERGALNVSTPFTSQKVPFVLSSRLHVFT